MQDKSLPVIDAARLNNAFDFERAVEKFRPTLHKYCTRMTGSVIDGEDVLQSTLVKAYEALDRSAQIDSWEAWLFRIAHNTAMDFFRRNKNQQAIHDDIDMDDETQDDNSYLVSDNLKQLAVLPPLQRSVLLLREVFGYQANEVAELLHTTPDAVKSALHRSRETLKKVYTLEPNTHTPLIEIDSNKLVLIKRYTELFNSHSFDEIKALLLHEVKLDMVNKGQMRGKPEVSNYFGNYTKKDDWYMEPGFVEGHPAALAFDRKDSKLPPKYFILVDFEEDCVRFIRDFRYADYVMEHAQWRRM